jgi:hypothetical protein
MGYRIRESGDKLSANRFDENGEAAIPRLWDGDGRHLTSGDAK